VININYYTFDLGTPIVQWQKLSPDGTGNPRGQNSNNITTNTPNSTPSETSSDTNKIVIISLSVGLGVVALGTIAAFTFIYIRMKKKNQEEFSDPNVIEIPSEAMSQRHGEYSPTYSPTPTLFRHSPSPSPVQGLPQQERYSRYKNLGSETPY
jgi:hypothetical protein